MTCARAAQRRRAGPLRRARDRGRDRLALVDAERTPRLPRARRAHARAARRCSRRAASARATASRCCSATAAPTSSSCSRRARIGAIAVPLNTRLARARAAPAPRRLHAARCSCTRQTLDALARGARASGRRRAARGCGVPRRLRGASSPRTRRARSILPVSPDDPMILMYTSGTTGRAEGRAAPAPQDALQLPQRAALLRARAATTACSSRCRSSTRSGSRSSRCPALYAGARAAARAALRRRARLAARRRRERITFLGGVPTHVRARCSTTLDGARPGRLALAALRFLFTRGRRDPRRADPRASRRAASS